MPPIPTQLKKQREQLEAGDVPPRESVRTVLRWFGAQRRSYYVVKNIREALAALKLTTDPDFESAFIDEPISIVRTDNPSSARELPSKSPEQPPAKEPQLVGESTPIGSDPAYRIGKLPSANRTPTWVHPSATLQEAITTMVIHDYSQLPVMTRPTDVLGMITWASIGKALYFGKETPCVGSCMLPAHEIPIATSLFAAIPVIVQHEYVLVRNAKKVITGIVTTADLSLQFRTLSEPFLLLGEAENHLRAAIDKGFTREQIIAARAPDASGRPVGSAADLGFGEYKRLLEDPANWELLRLKLDRRQFIAMLESVRVIRNNVMHFDPDGIAENDLQTLRQFASLVRDLAQSGLM